MNEVLFNQEIWGRTIVLTPWKIIGIVGALMFASRWIVQAYYSRRAGKPVTPRIFWVMSVIGSTMTLAYFTFSPKSDMVGIVQNFFPSMIAAYNLYLDLTYERRNREATAAAVAAKAAVTKVEPQPSGKHVVPTPR
jgi:lipid-A-disaccharide synthase-like uncharacterized protein